MKAVIVVTGVILTDVIVTVLLSKTETPFPLQVFASMISGGVIAAFGYLLWDEWVHRP